MEDNPESHNTPSALPDWRPHERLLAELPFDPSIRTLLCNTAGRGQFAIETAAKHPRLEITCQLHDQFVYNQCATFALPNLHWRCEADLPSVEFDAAALALGQHGEAEFVRDLLQGAWNQLRIGGQLIAATDNPRDRWLDEQLVALGGKLVRQSHEHGRIYIATKREPLRKQKRFECELVFRDGERLLKLRTRPGIFSHRQVDPGARALIRAMSILDGMHVLDLGCGSGAVAVAAAARASRVQVLALDSNPRAVEAVQWAAVANQLPSLHAMLDCDGSAIRNAPVDSWYRPGQFDLVATNPPYYSNFRIADLMIQTAEEALAPEGQLLVVTKSPEWYADRLADNFADIEFLDARQYIVVRATRRGR